MTRKLRASYYLLGALLGKYGKASVSMPGGCYFGERPIAVILNQDENTTPSNPAKLYIIPENGWYSNGKDATYTYTKNDEVEVKPDWVNHIPYIYENGQWVKYSETKVYTNSSWVEHSWKIYRKRTINYEETAVLGTGVLGKMILGME